METFERDGVVVLRGVLPAAWVQRLGPAVAAAYGGDATADLTELTGSAPVGADGEAAGRFRAGIDHWLEDPVMREFDCASPLPVIAATLMRSDQVWLYEDSILVKPPAPRRRPATTPTCRTSTWRATTWRRSGARWTP